MRILAAIPLLALATACADAGVIGPEPEALPETLALDRASIPGAREFHVQATFVGIVDPGETRFTPSGVLHAKDVLYEWVIVGDLVGSWFVEGGFMINFRNGMGTSMLTSRIIVQSSAWGLTGMFICNISSRLEHYPAATVQYAVVSGCRGTGDFDGMRLWGYLTNEANPGSGVAYDFDGLIW